MNQPVTYGLMGEFTTPESLVAAAEQAREAGFVRMEAYSPLPIHGLSEALGQAPTKMPLAILLGGLCGTAFGWSLCYYMTVLSYAHNVGGRPLYSWPAYVPITFETTVLFAAFTAVFGSLIADGFPAPYHPVFNVSRFARASQDRFFLCIEASDQKFDRDRTRQFLLQQGAREVSEVPE